MPLMTTVASGRWTSAPVLVAMAMGTKPKLATRAVMSTGRSLQRGLRGSDQPGFARDRACAAARIREAAAWFEQDTRLGRETHARLRPGSWFSRTAIIFQWLLHLIKYDSHAASHRGMFG